MRGYIIAIMLGIMLSLTSSAYAENGNSWRADGYNFKALKTISVQEITLPEELQDRAVLPLALKFAAENNAAKYLKNINTRYDGKIADCYIIVDVERYASIPKWYDPYYTTRERSNSHTNVYKDKQENKEYRSTETVHWTEAEAHPGGYEFASSVAVNVKVIDAKTGEEIYRYYNHAEDDKRIDMFNDLMKNFYKQFNKLVK